MQTLGGSDIDDDVGATFRDPARETIGRRYLDEERGFFYR
jgi:hypothetical protein